MFFIRQTGKTQQPENLVPERCEQEQNGDYSHKRSGPVLPGPLRSRLWAYLARRGRVARRLQFAQHFVHVFAAVAGDFFQAFQHEITDDQRHVGLQVPEGCRRFV